MKIHPYCATVPKMDDAQFRELVDDIATNGLLDHITLLDGEILDGRHRFRACQSIGIEPKFVEYDGDDPEAFVISKNKKRRHLSATQLAAWGAKLDALPRGGQKGNVNAAARKNESESVRIRSGQSESEIAKKLGISDRLLSAGKRVLREGAPEVFEAMEGDDVAAMDAARIADAPHEDQVEALKRAMDNRDKTLASAVNSIRKERLSEETMPELPADTYRVVVVDPPWEIEAGYDRPNRLLQSAGPPYPTMSLDEIKDMELPLLADDAWVFLWTIRSFLFDAPAVLEAWGVEFCFPMVWHKPWGPQVKERPQSNGEYILVGRKGKAEFRDLTKFQMVFDAPNPKDHSVKPDEFYELIKRVTVGPRLDMFSRRQIEGFYPWGKEAKV